MGTDEKATKQDAARSRGRGDAMRRPLGTAADGALIKVTLTRGLVGKKDMHRAVVLALGLSKYGSSCVHADTPTIRGMIKKVHHLVTVTNDGTAKFEKSQGGVTKKKSEKALAESAL
jgi:large subunit ribosomal protein L30